MGSAISACQSYEPQGEHIAAPLDEKTGERAYSTLVAGAAPRLFADLWRIAFETALDRSVAPRRFDKDVSMGELREASKQLAQEIELRIRRLPGMNAPFAYQGALSNAFMFRQYAQALPGARLGQFFWIVQAPVYADFHDEDMPADVKVRRDELTKTSLFASYESKTFIPSPTTPLYRRDTGEAVTIEELNALGLRLPSFSDRIGNYFGRFEFKSEPSDGIGLLKRRKIVVAAKQYVGKASSPLADVDDGIDEETFIEFGTSATSELTAFNGELLDGLDLREPCLACSAVGRTVSANQGRAA